MKTVITSTNNGLTSLLDKRFGRAAWYCLYDEASGATSFHENTNKNFSNGVGTKAVEKIVELKANKVISGDFGPKAKDLLDKFNIQMVIIQDDNTTIEDIIKKLSINNN